MYHLEWAPLSMSLCEHEWSTKPCILFAGYVSPPLQWCFPVIHAFATSLLLAIFFCLLCCFIVRKKQCVQFEMYIHLDLKPPAIYMQSRQKVTVRPCRPYAEHFYFPMNNVEYLFRFVICFRCDIYFFLWLWLHTKGYENDLLSMVDGLHCNTHTHSKNVVID